MKRNSPAFKLAQHVWQHAQAATPGHSWQRLNQGMHGAVGLAIGVGLRFGKEDFVRFMDEFRAGYWIGAGHEQFYSAAVQVRNMSACHAYEFWQDRKPFIMDGQRMYVGREFVWDGLRVRCTSFGPEHFIAVCTPNPVYRSGSGYERVKPTRLFRITHADLKLYHKNKKAATQVAAAATAAA